MDTVVGFLFFAVVLGIGTRRWRQGVRFELQERRERREWRRRHGL